RLKRLADSPEPFDLAAARHVEIRPEDNAYVFYGKAITVLGRPGEKGDRDPEDNRESLRLFLEGSERPDALYHQPGDLFSGIDLRVPGHLRDLSRLAHKQARQLAEAGDVTEAWKWHRAVMRASRHPGLHGPIVERLTGEALHAGACEEIAEWA